MRVSEPDGYSYGLFEVYYSANGEISWTVDATGLFSDTPNFDWHIERIKEAQQKPILDYDTGKEITHD